MPKGAGLLSACAFAAATLASIVDPAVAQPTQQSQTVRETHGVQLGVMVLERADEPDFDRQREGMVAALQVEALVAARHTGVSAFEGRILDAMAEVPRHAFVPGPLRPLSYLNRPLPLGFGHSMPSPFLTALMAQLAEIEPHERVLQTELNIGYQTAVLARLAARVDVTSGQATLAAHARHTLMKLGIRNVGLSLSDRADVQARRTPAPQADYDAILVERPAVDAPKALLARLRPNGRLVYPRLLADGGQVLTVIVRAADGRLTSRDVMPLKIGTAGRATPT
jgi:protein-L-isoaspartate(D-aspartate) O-methyltransferase